MKTFKKILMLVLILLLVLTLSGCSLGLSSPSLTAKNNRLTKIENTILSYDTETKIIYYFFDSTSGNLSYGYMSPFLSENGKPCKYDIANKKFVEIK